MKKMFGFITLIALCFSLCAFGTDPPTTNQPPGAESHFYENLDAHSTSFVSVAPVASETMYAYQLPPGISASVCVASTAELFSDVGNYNKDPIAIANADKGFYKDMLVKPLMQKPTGHNQDNTLFRTDRSRYI